MKALAAYVSVSLFFSSMTYAQAPATKEALTHRLEAIAAATGDMAWLTGTGTSPIRPK